MSALRRFKPYPAYKDSGVEWLGEIPAHWEVKRLKRIFRVVNGSTPTSGEPSYWDGDIPWVTPEDLGDLVGSTISATRRNITAAGYQSCGTTIVPAGSLVLSTRAPIGHLAIAGVDLCTNQGCRSLVFRSQTSRKFFFYELLAARPELESLGQGSTFRELAKGMLEDVGLTDPPEPEQRAIAAFLDRETARIDALVAKKERLIELLQEKRAALITRAVTKGLDPTVPMKDSGVEWLGEIPAGWQALKIKRVCSFAYGESLATDARVDGEVEVYGSNGPVGCHDRANTLAPCLVIGRKGSFGKINYSARPVFAIDTTFFVDRRFTRSHLRWLYYALADARLDSATKDSAIPSLDREDAYVRELCLPPEPEQRAIAAFLDRETAKIDALIAKVREAIDRLKELRTALISAAVTGKIDVREESP